MANSYLEWVGMFLGVLPSVSSVSFSFRIFFHSIP